MSISIRAAYVINATINTAIQASIGYLSVWSVTNINPVAGAVFGATYHMASLALDPTFNKKKSTLASKMIGTAIKIAIAATITMKALGIALSLTTLTVSATVLIVPPLALAALFCSALTLMSVLGIREGDIIEGWTED